MQTPTVTFTETMCGQVVIADAASEERQQTLLTMPERAGAQAIQASVQQGVQRNLALPMAWQDLAIAVQTEPAVAANGLSGVIEAGKIVVGGLATEPLAIRRGEFTLLPVTTQGDRCMRYRLHCRRQDGQHFLLYGFKCISNSNGRGLPLVVWQETTTLYVAIYTADEQGTPMALAATGVIYIHPLDFLKQLLTMRARAAASPWAYVRNLACFGRFFAAGLTAVYLSRGGQTQAQSTPEAVAKHELPHP